MGDPVILNQGVIFPAGVRVFPTGNLQNPQEILTKTLIIEQILYSENFKKNIFPKQT